VQSIYALCSKSTLLAKVSYPGAIRFMITGSFDVGAFEKKLATITQA
jgi:hypothetical protein